MKKSIHFMDKETIAHKGARSGHGKQGIIPKSSNSFMEYLLDSGIVLGDNMNVPPNLHGSFER